MNKKFELNQIVYHRDVYNHNEPLRIVGIRFDQLELEGDYSGGTNNVKQRTWMPLIGVSRIRGYKYKDECRKFVDNLEEMSDGRYAKQDVLRLKKMILDLTDDVRLNPEITK